MSAYVDSYIETRAGELDPSWQFSARNKINERTKSFKTLVSVFVKHTKRDELSRFDVDRQFVWEDVRAMASDAIEQDASKTKWRQNPFRAAGRSFQQNASNLEMLVEFLPNGEFTGILCGALTFVFCAAKRLDEVRNKIMNCLESLPDIVEDTEEYVQIYAEDTRVWSAAEDLYLGILDGVEAMLQWIDKSAFERAFNALLRPATYGKSLEEETIKGSIEANVAKFHKFVTRSLHKNFNKSLKALKEQLSGQVKLAQWMDENPQAARLFKTSFVTLDQLRISININLQIIEKDLVTAMIDAQNVCTEDMTNRAMLVLRNNSFAAWLQSTSSQILYLNGRMDLSPEQEAASPLTLLSCSLVQRLRQSDRSLPLVYLCGRHNRPNDPYMGPSGIMRCLNAQIAQSLTPREVDLSGINLSVVDGVRGQQLEALFTLFRLFLLSATGKVVFVILEGVSWLEVGRHVQGLGAVVSFLWYLVHELNQQGHRVILKVLVTNSATSNYARRWLPKECIVEMEEAR
ncbi:hypothetical protein CGRA01v4_14054 [Colletotrichum graminicola]|uniref:DUF7708 domain-containing protein n=1 Tax=Colletotrichum graminicola (strain M1.001 / M2 / FGSC 10212) TaxID=645133 RepID=E3QUS9_COLGM|nr:uncharacterized protein GLRG_09761 [Colletotrichum graminicola M1.001]EFQ34617.1 hypothetical protein GLRG_09761 [Colletotrichum graminicola M1.001]WDK22764.1 hypothetical protein CGRA01v4_14054 [Colletotrichum graminicola]